MDALAPASLPKFDAALFLDPPTKGLSGSATSAYRSDREAYLGFCLNKGLSVGDASSLEAYKGYLLSSGMKPTSINRKLCGIKSGLISYLIAVKGKEGEGLFRNLYKSVHLVKVAKNERVIRPEAILSEEEIDSLIKSSDKKLGLIISFLSKTGCRISEAVSIKLSDIDIQDNAVSISVIGKGMKVRTVYISHADLEEIRTGMKGKTFLFETIHGNPFDRTNITKAISKLSRRVLGKRAYSHLFRHSFATNMIRKTRKIQAVSEYLGHQDVSTTLNMYSHEVLSLSDLAI